MIDEFLLEERYIENQLHQQSELVEKQRQESKAEKREIEARIDTSSELLVNGRIAKEKITIKLREDEQRLRDLQGRIIKQEGIKAAPTQRT